MHMEKNMMAALSKIMQKKEADDKYSTLTTKGICLNCGREALARSAPYAHIESPAFTPALNAASTVGPDVMRAGFKIPVKTNSQYSNLIAMPSMVASVDDLGADSLDLSNGPRSTICSNFLVYSVICMSSFRFDVSIDSCRRVKCHQGGEGDTTRSGTR